MLTALLHRLRTLLCRLRRPDKVMYIGGSDTLPPPLPRDEEAALLARLDGGELSVRQTLIERNLRLVVYIARRFENTGINIEDHLNTVLYRQALDELAAKEPENRHYAEFQKRYATYNQ